MEAEEHVELEEELEQEQRGIRRRGRPPSAQISGMVKITMTLNPDDTEWAKAQPEGLSGMVRRLLREAREKQKREQVNERSE